MPLTADEWLAQVRAATLQHFPEAALDAQTIRHTRVKVRIKISEDRLIDLFFREETERTDYALTKAQAS